MKLEDQQEFLYADQFSQVDGSAAISADLICTDRRSVKCILPTICLDSPSPSAIVWQSTGIIDGMLWKMLELIDQYHPAGLGTKPT